MGRVQKPVVRVQKHVHASGSMHRERPSCRATIPGIILGIMPGIIPGIVPGIIPDIVPGWGIIPGIVP